MIKYKKINEAEEKDFQSTYHYSKEDDIIKEKILKHLRLGYASYADIFENLSFHVQHTKKPFGAYMHPSDGSIYLYAGVTDILDQSWLVRHEILHFILAHEQRMLEELARMEDKRWDDLDPKEKKRLEKELYKKRDPRMFKGWEKGPLSNFAADFEVADWGYDEQDKERIRQFKINGKLAKGLITEDQRPDLLDKPVEEILRILKKEEEKLSSLLPRDIIIGELLNDPANNVLFRDNKGNIYARKVEGVNAPTWEVIDGKLKYKSIKGKFVDSHTFLDENGDKIDLSAGNIKRKTKTGKVIKLDTQHRYCDKNTKKCYRYNKKTLYLVALPDQLKGF